MNGDNDHRILNRVTAHRFLLSAAEEGALGRLVASGAYATDVLGRSRELCAAERSELEQQVRTGRRAVEQLELHNLRLVHWVAKRFPTSGMEYGDLVQEGWFGLRRAAELFDPDRGCKFSTYASAWIRQSIERGIANRSRLIRVPVHAHDTLKRVVRKRDELLLLEGRASARDIADQLAMSEGSVTRFLGLARGPVSIDQPLGDGRTALTEILLKPGGPPADPAEVAERRQAITDALAGFDERTREVVARRFGLTDGTEHTLEEIGRDFGVTRERIRQIETKALERLRCNGALRRLIAA